MEKFWLRVEAWMLGFTASDGTSHTPSSKQQTPECFHLRDRTSTISTRPFQSSKRSRMATRLLSLDMWERRPPGHWTFIILIAGELEVAHHRFGVSASPE
jgi:hypothetical protein